MLYFRVAHRFGFGRAHLFGKVLARYRWMWGVLVVLGREGVDVLPGEVAGIIVVMQFCSCLGRQGSAHHLMTGNKRP